MPSSRPLNPMVNACMGERLIDSAFHERKMVSSTNTMMKTISLKLPAPLANWLANRANELGRSRSDLVRQALEEQREGKNSRGEKSCAALLAEFGGFFRGPRDLSTNPNYMRDFGK